MAIPINIVYEKYEMVGTGSAQHELIDIAPSVLYQRQVVINDLELRGVAIRGSAVSPLWNTSIIDLSFIQAGIEFPGIRIGKIPPIEFDSKFQSDRIKSGNGPFFQFIKSGASLSFHSDRDIFFRDEKLVVTQRSLLVDSDITINGQAITTDQGIPEAKKNFILNANQSFSIKVSHNAPSESKLVFFLVATGTIIPLEPME